MHAQQGKQGRPGMLVRVSRGYRSSNMSMIMRQINGQAGDENIRTNETNQGQTVQCLPGKSIMMTHSRPSQEVSLQVESQNNRVPVQEQIRWSWSWR